MDPAFAVLYALAFPGLLFLVGYSLFLQYVDRKVVARVQNRVGPPFLQPFADLVKLLSKEDITPEGVDARVMRAIPLLAFAAVATAFLYVPVVGPTPFGFQGDLVVVLYLLTLPTILLFLAGWTSRNVFAAIGGVRVVTQLFIYEVPFFLALLGPALMAGTWSINDILAWQAGHGWAAFLQPIGFIIVLVALQAKLERAPFDIPDAETEIVAGPWTELTGRKLAVMRLSIDMSLVAGAGLIAAIFLGGPGLPGISLSGWAGEVAGFLAFLGKTLGILLLLTGIRSATGRIRIDQLNAFGWKWMAGLALVQVLLVLLLGPWEVSG